MKRLFGLIYLILLLSSCHSQSCKDLPSYFNSYNEAISEIEHSTFKFADKANTSRSSWITSARYYSCDGITGYFIYTTNRNYQYVHKGVPIEIWKQFKAAPSMGSYYNQYIKHKYRLVLE